MTEQQKKSINISIDEGKEFFAHELSINFSPTQFIMDFRNVTPRTDPRSREVPLLRMRHNLVMVDPWHAKKIHELLGKMLEEYEKQFGGIELPKALKMHEKKMKNNQSKPKASTKEIMPDYFG